MGTDFWPPLYISDKIQLKITVKFNFVKNYQSGKKSHFMRYTLYDSSNLIMKYVISNQPHNESKAKEDYKLKLYLNNKWKAKGSQ